MRTVRTLRALSLLFFFAPAVLAAQGVLVAPTATFIDPRTGGASVELYAPGNDPVEVSISLMFGYPVSDSLGHVGLFTDPAPDSTVPSAAPWVEAFPRRLLLRPHERRTVRLLARPPAALPDGEYWSRLVVDAKGGRVTLESPASSSAIQVGLDLEVRTIVSLFYRKGQVHTGLAMSGTRAQLVGDSLHVCVRFTREGDAAFLGALHATLADSAGTPLATVAIPLAVYYTLEPCVTTPVPELAPGRYVVHVLVDTDRSDLKRDTLLPIAPLRDSVTVLVAPRGR